MSKEMCVSIFVSRSRRAYIQLFTVITSRKMSEDSGRQGGRKEDIQFLLHILWIFASLSICIARLFFSCPGSPGELSEQD